MLVHRLADRLGRERVPDERRLVEQLAKRLDITVSIHARPLTLLGRLEGSPIRPARLHDST